MTDITLYHNPRCSKSRQALALLQERGIEPTVVEYLKHPLSHDDIRTLLTQLDISARQLLRKGEDAYKELQLGNPDTTEKSIIEAMAKYPKLIERPIGVVGKKAKIGRPPEQILELIS